MKLCQPSKKLILSTIGMLIAIAILFSVVPAAYAESNGPLTPIPGLGRIPNETLKRMHNKEMGWFNDQAAMLIKANSLSKSFQELIDAESKQGKDVTILKDALAAFESELTASREIHNLAGATIFSLVGFKVNGDVRDRLAAGQSLLDGRAFLKDANFRLFNAMKMLRKSFDNWRHTRISGIPLPLTPNPTPTPQ